MEECDRRTNRAQLPGDYFTDPDGCPRKVVPPIWQPVSGEAQALLRLGREAADAPAGAGRFSTLTSHVLSNQSRPTLYEGGAALT
jgi:hypothetical protein